MPREKEGARNARVLSDPRTSAPRGTEACRVVLKPQVRRFSGVPRAVFLGLLRMTPGGLTFQDFSRVALMTKPYPPLWELTCAPAL